MAPDSLIVIDDLILPNAGVRWRQAHLDMLMMASLAGCERTQEQWEKLLKKSGTGLNISGIHMYDKALRKGIIEVARS